MNSSKRILIVEDNADLAGLMQLHLNDQGYVSDIVADGKRAVEQFNMETYDLILLDLMLPVMDGIAVCQKIRAKSASVPIVMVTSKSSELERVLGLEVGADDYVTKPFSIPELMARIKARLRAVEAIQSQDDEQPFQYDGMNIDFSQRQVAINGKNVELTAREFDLLAHFARNPGKVFSRVQLLDQVWGYHYEGYEHTVNSHMNRLRSKIETDPAKPRYILTVWGVGYKFTRV